MFRSSWRCFTPSLSSLQNQGYLMMKDRNDSQKSTDKRQIDLTQKDEMM